MDTFPDLGSLTDLELKDLITELTKQEMEISYERRVLHGKIDILRAELVARLRRREQAIRPSIMGDDIEQLTAILSGNVGGPDDPNWSAEGPA